MSGESSSTNTNPAAAIYSLIETAKLNGIDPEAYLRNIIARIADHPINRIGELLPWNWLALRSPKPRSRPPIKLQATAVAQPPRASAIAWSSDRIR